MPATNNSDLVADIIVTQNYAYYNVSQDTMNYFHGICRLHVDSCLYDIYLSDTYSPQMTFLKDGHIAMLNKITIIRSIGLR